MIDQYKLGDIVEMKKQHPCKKSLYWKVIREGMDVKIECLGCGAIVMMPVNEFKRKCKRIITENIEE